MKILVIGAGAVGGYFGARLAQAGRDVTFLVRSGRAAELKTSGLQVLSPHGDFTIHPKLVTASELSGTYDLVLLALKSYALKTALDDFTSAVGPETIILPVLNGMAHMDVLGERFGSALIGGAARIAAQLEGGKVRQFAPMQSIVYGELSGETTPRIQALDQAMTGAGFDASLSTAIVQEMWEKWAFLAGLGAATCLLKGDVGEIVASDEGRRTMEALISECQAIPAACGHALRPPSSTTMTAMLTAQGSTLTSSMYRDMIASAPVEVEEILADYVRRGEANGVDSPLLGAATATLRIYEMRRAKA